MDLAHNLDNIQLNAQAIQLEVSPGCVKTAVLHMVDPEVASPADTRVSAMHERDPIHTMMFDIKGLLLTANKAALPPHKYHHGPNFQH